MIKCVVLGRVYNVTPYLEFHPGGIPEIMRGVGRDGTDLFDEVRTCYSPQQKHLTPINY